MRIIPPNHGNHFSQTCRSRILRQTRGKSGFWQIKLLKRSQPLTTFMTPWGHYCFNVLPFGISWGWMVEWSWMQYWRHINLWFNTSRTWTSIVRSSSLSQLSTRHIKFQKCEFITRHISNFLVKSLDQMANGISLDRDKTKAINNMPSPNNIHEVRSLLGMVNQFVKFTNNLAEITKPIVIY